MLSNFVKFRRKTMNEKDDSRFDVKALTVCLILSVQMYTAF